MKKRPLQLLYVFLLLPIISCTQTSAVKKTGIVQQEIFPLVDEHVHGSTIVELPNGDLLAAWFQGTGERWADDVRIMGARLHVGDSVWTSPFVMADVPGFPDINPVLFLDDRQDLWLVWYTVIANQWETSLPTYRISDDYQQKDGAPEWKWQQVLFVKPGDKTERGIVPGDRFVESVKKQVESYSSYIQATLGDSVDITSKLEAWKNDLLSKARGENMLRKGYYTDANGQRVEGEMGYPYFRRVGWQTKNKAVVLPGGRIILPLYSDGFSFSLMAFTDDHGAHWSFSNPLVAPGNIQPSIAIKKDGTLVAYMRDNRPPPKRLQVSESTDQGKTWSDVRDSQLPNPGSGADVVTLNNGHWVLAYNDTEEGRNSLAVALSEDEGKTWPFIRHLELDTRDKQLANSGSYPSIIQGKNDAIFVVYSFHRGDRKNLPDETIKFASIDEAWIKSGDIKK